MQLDRHFNFPFFILLSHTSLTVAFLNRLQREESEVSGGYRLASTQNMMTSLLPAYCWIRIK